MSGPNNTLNIKPLSKKIFVEVAGGLKVDVDKGQEHRAVTPPTH